MDNPEAKTSNPNPEIRLGPVTAAEIDGLVELMLLRPPAFWMRMVSAADLRAFLSHSVGNPHAVVLAARARDGNSPIGYVFAVVDSVRFWLGLSLRNPLLARVIVRHRLVRLRELRRRNKSRKSAGGAAAELPEFAWSPSYLGHARIIGLYVRKEHHNRGVAMDLYFSLFEALKAKGCSQVEEYAAPDYAEFAGKFPKLCGWSLQPCVCGGFKITRAL